MFSAGSYAPKQPSLMGALQQGQGIGQGMGQGNYGTTITPQSIYSPQLTQQGMNQSLAQGAQSSDPRFLMKQNDRPGVSRDAGSFSAIAPQSVGIMGDARNQAANLQMGDYVANQNNLLQGETARENEGLGLGTLLARLNESQIGNNNRNINGLFSALQGYF